MKEQHSWRKQFWKVILATGIISLIIGAMLSVLFDRLARHFGH
jgi:hypothetical protein